MIKVIEALNDGSRIIHFDAGQLGNLLADVNEILEKAEEGRYTGFEDFLNALAEDEAKRPVW